MQHGFEITKERFHLTNPDIYYVWGIWPKEDVPEVYLDETKVDVELEEVRTVSIPGTHKGAVEVKMELHLPANADTFSRISIYANDGRNRQLWYTEGIKSVLKRRSSIQYFVDSVTVDKQNGMCALRGWAVADEALTVRVLNEKGQALSYTIKHSCRTDVNNQFQELSKDTESGFYMEIQTGNASSLQLVFATSKGEAYKKISVGKAALLTEKVSKYTKKGISYLRAHGLTGFTKKVAAKIRSQRIKPQPYEEWLKKHLPSQEALEEQRNYQFSVEPKFSIVVPLYKTPEDYLVSLVESLKKQTYTNWELCLSDGSGKDSPIEGLLEKIQKEEPRVKVISHDKNLQISENTNAAISIATGDYIAFADHDDELAPHALFECALAIERNPEIDAIYSDEDKMSMDGKAFFEPHFKPDFNIDLLCTVNYICHLFVVRKDLLETVGGLRSEYDGAQDYDFVLRIVEQAKNIHHIAKMLYHWRCHQNSTAENPESKRYAFEAGKRAIEAHYERIGVSAEVSHGEYLGLYRTRFIRSYDPLISIIIPNKDHIEDLKRCIDSIEEKSTYKNYEYIIVENNSTQEETFLYYKELERSNPKVRVVYWDGIFNYSAINNYGIQYAKGEYYLLLNNDTEIINPDCLEELLGYCMRKDVGAVGARLYYEDDTIQHAGVVIGFGGIAGHCFVQQPRGYSGYCHRIICAQDYSAVTAACMMVRKDVFEEVEGLTTELAVAFNDIDFCMKIRKAGYLIVYNPYAELYHYESKSRGLEDTPEKIERFNKEIATFARRWPEILKNGDPFYNCNLTLDSQDFSRKRL